MTEETEAHETDGEEEPSAEGRESADDVAQELKEREDELEEGGDES